MGAASSKVIDNLLEDTNCMLRAALVYINIFRVVVHVKLREILTMCTFNTLRDWNIEQMIKIS